MGWVWTRAYSELYKFRKGIWVLFQVSRQWLMNIEVAGELLDLGEKKSHVTRRQENHILM